MTEQEWHKRHAEALAVAERGYRALKHAGEALALLEFQLRMEAFNREVQRERPRTA